ncbi:MAG: UDP-N-acetylmuramate dehydrogenase [Ignavibacteriaceae bacterium]
MNLLSSHSLINFNTFGVDVKAKFFADVFSEEELITLINDQNFKKEKKYFLGGGSNILFTKDFDGIIIKVSIGGINIKDENADSVLIEAGAGVIWNDLVKFCVNKNFGGIENLTLIPGTVGAAPIQNIGAYGQELASTFESLSGIFVESSERNIFGKNECNFSYRSSIFKNELKNKFVITSVQLKLSKNPRPNISYKILREYLSEKKISTPTIADISNAVASLRKQRLPDPSKIGNAGSIFKNPVVSRREYGKLKSEFPEIVSFPSEGDSLKLSAGWLIEKCGWKGKRVGAVGTSSDHALIVCNFGNASGADILDFTMRLKEEVANKFGIELQEEVNIL